MSLDITFIAKRPTEVYENNITHNLNTMAEAAGVYLVLWRPEELGINRAGDMIPYLKKGLDYIEDNEEELTKLEPANGWGTYVNLHWFVHNTLEAAIEHPDAIVEVCR